MKPQVRAVGLALAVVALLSGTVAAGHLASVTSYTGCLVSKDGVIIKIKAGDAPSSPCSGGMVQVHFSGGDITSISVTGALTGGGDNGAITIGLKPEFTLPTGCTSGEIAEWNGSSWVCGTDNDTTYSPGIGLDQEGTTFHIAPSYRVKNTPDCLDGEFATGFANSGTIICAAPPAPPAAGTPVLANVTYVASHQFAGPDFEKILSKTLPEGTYAFTATVELSGNFYQDEGEFIVRCELRDGSTVLGGTGSIVDVAEPGGGFAGEDDVRQTLPVTGTRAVPAAGTEISIWCRNSGSPTGRMHGAQLMTLRIAGSF